MAHGAAYPPRSKSSEDDRASMISEPTDSTYQPYQPYRPARHQRQSSNVSQLRASWAPGALQQSLPPLSSPNRASTVSASIFGSRAALTSPFLDSVAWESSTNFRAQVPDSPKQGSQLNVAPLSALESPSEGRRYFRHPRHIPEPWNSGYWKRFPWWGFGATFLVILCGYQHVK